MAAGDVKGDGTQEEALGAEDAERAVGVPGVSRDEELDPPALVVAWSARRSSAITSVALDDLQDHAPEAW